jgi:rhodanese-related sulfurtransferase
MDWMPLLVGAAVLIGLFGLNRVSFVGAQKVRQLLRQGALVVDVRSPAEFEAGHVTGAVNLPLRTLGDDLPRRVPDRNQVLLLYCLSGVRSGIATRRSQAMGYSHAFNLGSYRRARRIADEA